MNTTTTPITTLDEAALAQFVADLRDVASLGGTTLALPAREWLHLFDVRTQGGMPAAQAAHGIAVELGHQLADAWDALRVRMSASSVLAQKLLGATEQSRPTARDVHDSVLASYDHAGRPYGPPSPGVPVWLAEQPAAVAVAVVRLVSEHLRWTRQ